MSAENSAFREMSVYDAPAIHAALDEICQKAGIAKPKLFSVQGHNIPNPVERFNLEHIAHAGLSNGNDHVVIVGDKFAEMMGHYNPHSPISDEFKGFLAHELGHIKHGDLHPLKYSLLKNSPYLGIIAGMGGVWFYDHLKQKEKKNREAGMSEENITAHSKAEWEKSDQITHETEQFRPMVTVSKYIAGGLLGLGAGVAAYALGHHHIEFRADRFSAQMLEDGKPLARALELSRNKLNDILRERPEVMDNFRKQGFWKNFLDSFSHPSDEARIAKLEGWSR